MLFDQFPLYGTPIEGETPTPIFTPTSPPTPTLWQEQNTIKSPLRPTSLTTWLLSNDHSPWEPGLDPLLSEIPSISSLRAAESRASRGLESEYDAPAADTAQPERAVVGSQKHGNMSMEDPDAHTAVSAFPSNIDFSSCQLEGLASVSLTRVEDEVGMAFMAEHEHEQDQDQDAGRLGDVVEGLGLQSMEDVAFDTLFNLPAPSSMMGEIDIDIDIGENQCALSEEMYQDFLSQSMDVQEKILGFDFEEMVRFGPWSVGDRDVEVEMDVMFEDNEEEEEDG